MSLLPPLPGDDKRAEDILDEIHVIFTRTGCRMRYQKPRWRIDRHPGVKEELPVAGVRPYVQRKKTYLGVFGGWKTIGEFIPETGRWRTDLMKNMDAGGAGSQDMAQDHEMLMTVVQAMLMVIAKHKAHLMMNQQNRDNPTWLLCISNEFGEYRMVGELSQITPKRIDFRTLSPKATVAQ